MCFLYTDILLRHFPIQKFLKNISSTQLLQIVLLFLGTENEKEDAG